MADAVLAEILAVLKRIEARLAIVMEADGLEMGEAVCVHCGSEKLADTSTATLQRVTCLTCGKSDPSEALNG